MKKMFAWMKLTCGDALKWLGNKLHLCGSRLVYSVLGQRSAPPITSVCNVDVDIKSQTKKFTWIARTFRWTMTCDPLPPVCIKRIDEFEITNGPGAISLVMYVAKCQGVDVLSTINAWRKDIKLRNVDMLLEFYDGFGDVQLGVIFKQAYPERILMPTMDYNMNTAVEIMVMMHYDSMELVEKPQPLDIVPDVSNPTAKL